MRGLLGKFRKNRTLFVAMLAVMAASVPMMAFAQSDTLSVDMGALFTETNNWINILLPVFAIGGGIAIAAALLNMVINMIKKSIGQAG
jgi:hypothetical protein